jgi:sugar phosphate isomerase/epimerase
MLQLVNLSNYITDLELINNNAGELEAFLSRNGLDGIEMMVCAPWDSTIHRKEWIKGVHLWFWPSWLDFWRGDYQELLRQFGSREDIIASYGGLERQDWLNLYRTNIDQARQVEAEYVVFHVCHNRLEEVFDWKFSASSREVIEATIEVVNALADEIPPSVTVLFENLWWPGLTLLDKDLVALLVERVKHPNIGIMLDTGHLMNTNQDLQSEEEGVEYILRTLAGLCEYSRYIRGIHLNCSLSGNYVRQTKTFERRQVSLDEAISHVLKIDQHMPFGTLQVRRILDWVRPDWLVHEFIQKIPDDWEEKIVRQQRSTGLRR